MNYYQNKINSTLFALGALLSLVSLVDAAPRAILVEEVKNDQSSFYVRVDVDRSDRTYVVGETVKINAISEKAGYLYLFYLQADKKVVCLFPNKVQQNNKIAANSKITIPSQNSGFRLRVGEPVGTEILKAVVTQQPLKSLDLDILTKSNFTFIDDNDAKAINVEATNTESREWAEHMVAIKTVKTASERKTRQQTHRRIAVLIGISDYKDPRIPELRICHLDSEKMGEALKKYGDFDEVISLVNEQATLKNIENLIRIKAPEMTKPGDEVLIFWSGHGDSIADTDGDEKDGRDELLVPYDAKIEDKKQTCITDDVFGRWLQALDGRNIVVLLDACKSGGQANNEKGLNPSKSVIEGFDFLDGEFARTKDIGQKQAAVLASSRASQISLVRREGDLSVMTYFLIERIKSSSGKLTLQDAYKHLANDIPNYVKDKFPGHTQTPVLIGNEELDFNFKK
ncbi:MAG: hypothetical protein CME33_11665 [Gimesia sp.]|jgi:hypothetical protein|uniref:DUF4384 domain-containing protein n=1 Tax=Gimesia sp. TaxID=2024833 RepID=UPI000C5437BD|nr:DUF4384 domain-containing protein [Gimesia sp.]MAX37206.1 hypothetical protein [Gimesia sp.]|tara:strand:+ start:3175 stop:4542 length:1368 start_codon:yes stop_codon:yes gene_type:complete